MKKTMTLSEFHAIEARESIEGNPELPYEVINLTTDESHGRYATLDEAKGCVAYDHLDRHFAIWHDTQGRVCWCDEYEGDDDRVKQGLGQPNASEQR